MENVQNNNPVVSVVIPVYNSEKYLDQCLDSVVGQTFENLEIICVDDGSTDRSGAIVERYASLDPRITVIRRQNGGLASARNAAYPYLRGKYTLFVDSDDYIEPNLCEKAVSVAESEQADLTFFLYHSTSKSYDWFPLEKFLERHLFSEIDLPVLMEHMTAWSKLWKTDFLLTHQLTFPEGIHFEDNVVHWKAMLLEPKLALVPERLYWYRLNSDSISNDKQSTRFFDIIDCFDKIKRILDENKQLDPKWYRFFYRQKRESVYWRFCAVTAARKREMLQRIRTSCDGDDEIGFGKDIELPSRIRDFYDTVHDALDESGRYADTSMKCSHCISVQRNRERIIDELKKLGRFAFVPHLGNLGHVLTAQAEYQLFDRNELQYDIYRGQLTSDSLVYGGGFFSDGIPSFSGVLDLFRDRSLKRIVLLPSVFQDCPGLLDLIDERFVVFCSETESYDYVQNYLRKTSVKATVFPDHDMLFSLSGGFLTGDSFIDSSFRKICRTVASIRSGMTNRGGYKIAWLFRDDEESLVDRSKAGIESSFDLSACGHSNSRNRNDCNLYSKLFFAALDTADIIVTNRLQVGIASLLFGKTVFLLDHSHERIAAVYEHSMRSFSQVRFVKNPSNLLKNIDEIIATGNIVPTSNAESLDTLLNGSAEVASDRFLCRGQ